MTRFALLALALLWAGSTAAQSPLDGFADPTVSLTGRFGGVIWSPNPEGSYPDDLMAGLVVHVATPRWGAQVGYLESDRIRIPLDISLSLATAGANAGGGDSVYGPVVVEELGPLTFRSLYTAAGPRVEWRGLHASVGAGPAVLWGTERINTEAPCLSGCAYPGLTRYGREEPTYVAPAAAVALQGAFKLAGRVWFGGETTALFGTTGSHASTTFSMRVDLRRPAR